MSKNILILFSESKIIVKLFLRTSHSCSRKIYNVNDFLTHQITLVTQSEQKYIYYPDNIYVREKFSKLFTYLINTLGDIKQII